MAGSESEMSAVSKMAELDQFLSTPQDISALLIPADAKEQKSTNNSDVWPFEMLKWNDPMLLFKSCETLALLIRNERWRILCAASMQCKHLLKLVLPVKPYSITKTSHPRPPLLQGACPR